jgi:small subunit ribosomal protein S18
MATKSKEAQRVLRTPARAAKQNLLNKLGMAAIDYKDTATLRLFISPRGKIRAREATGLTVRQQRQVATAIKNAREMALLPYPGAILELPG